MAHPLQSHYDRVSALLRELSAALEDHAVFRSRREWFDLRETKTYWPCSLEGSEWSAHGQQNLAGGNFYGFGKANYGYF